MNPFDSVSVLFPWNHLLCVNIKQNIPSVLETKTKSYKPLAVPISSFLIIIVKLSLKNIIHSIFRFVFTSFSSLHLMDLVISHILCDRWVKKWKKKLEMETRVVLVLFCSNKLLWSIYNFHYINIITYFCFIKSWVFCVLLMLCCTWKE